MRKFEPGRSGPEVSAIGNIAVRGDRDPPHLQAMVGRPVNIHATADVYMYIRDFFGQPFFMIVEPEETENNSDTASTA